MIDIHFTPILLEYFSNFEKHGIRPVLAIKRLSNN